MTKTKVENFDDLFTGNPVDIERNLTALLEEARSLTDKSIYLQVMSQIALAQAMQQKFTEAHSTLDTAEELLTNEYPLAQVRLILERGRVFHQSDNIDLALPLFIKSYELSAHHHFDIHTINAAHMVAIVIKDPNEKIRWNKMAIELATTTKNEKAEAWLSSLYNNLAQSYIEAEQFDDAYKSFKQCKTQGQKSQHSIVIRGAKWGMARALRSLNRLDEALILQLEVLEEYDTAAKKSELPIELIRAGRGVVYEELAEIYNLFTRKFAMLAYKDLSKDQWFQKLEPSRLKRILELADFNG